MDSNRAWSASATGPPPFGSTHGPHPPGLAGLSPPASIRQRSTRAGPSVMRQTGRRSLDRGSIACRWRRLTGVCEMPEFPSWKRPNVGFPEAVQLGRSQLGRVVSDLRAGAGLATRAVPTRAVEIAEQTRGRFEQLPGVVLGELRRRVNLLDLATKQDVAAQSKLGRN